MIGRSKRNLLAVFLTSLNEAIFRVIRKALENNVVNATIYFVFLLLGIIQICPIYLAIGLQVVNEGEGSGNFKSTINIIKTISGINFTLDMNLVQMAIFSIAYFCVYIILMFVMVYFESGKVEKRDELGQPKCSTWIYKLLSVVFTLISTLLSFTTVTLFFMPLKCDYSGNSAVFKNDKSQKCWTGLHLAIVIIDVINILLYIIYLVIFETLFNDTSPRSNIPWACTQANVVKLLKHLSNFTVSVFIVIDDKAELFHYLFVIVILIELGILYLLFMSPAFINYIIGRAMFFFELYTLFTAVSMYCLKIFDKNLNPVIFGVIQLIFISLCSVAIFLKSKYDQYILSIEVTSNKNDSFKEYYYYELFRFLDWYCSGESDIFIKLYGIYSNHQMFCKNPNCKCSKSLINKSLTLQKRSDEIEHEQNNRNQNEGLYENLTIAFKNNMLPMFQINWTRSVDTLQKPETKEEDSKDDDASIRCDNYKILVNTCSRLLDFEIDSNFSSITLRMIGAYFFREYIGNLFRSTYELLFIEEKQKPSFRCRFLIYKYLQVIDEEIYMLAKKATADNTVDIEKIMKFEQYHETFRKQTETASAMVNRFWEQLKSKDLDVNGLYEIGSKMSNIYQEMQENYNAAMEIFPHNYKMLAEFGSFEKYIMNNDLIAKDYEVHARQIAKEQMDQNREGVQNYEGSTLNVNITQNTFTCVISGNPNTMGDIVSINAEVLQILGFKPSDIIGQNCGVLCPQYISQKHNQILESFIHRGNSELLKKRHILLACNSEGFLIILESIIKVYPSLNDGIRFVGIFKELEDYGDYFNEKSTGYLQQDFALIVTSMDGQILGISQTCMTVLGIPVSPFKFKSTSEDAISINTFIKDINDPDIEKSLLSEGMTMTLNTKSLRFSINKENISKKEARALRNQSGVYNVRIRLKNESYYEGMINVKIYKLLILSRDTTPKNANVAQKETLKVPEDAKKMIRKNSKGQLSDREDAKSSVAENDTPTESLPNLKELSDLKQKMNTKSSSVNVSTIQLSINLIFLLILVLSTIEFVMLIVDYKECVSGIEIIHNSNKRVIDIGMIHAEALTMYYIGHGNDIAVENIDMYEYSSEYGFRSVATLGIEQDYLNTIDFSYTDSLRELEKSAVVGIMTKGSGSTNFYAKSTINTAVTQYSGQAANFMTFSKIINAGDTDGFYFIFYNGIGNITIVGQQSAAQFIGRLNDRIGRFFIYYIIGVLIVGLALIVFLAVLVPRLISLQREKINVFLLYTQMTRKEVNEQAERCIEYQKNKGFLEYENVNEDESKGSIESDEGLQNMLTTANKEVKVKEELKLNIEENKEDKTESSSSSDDSSESVKDENEMTIQEQINPNELRSSLATNKLSLILLMIMISVVYCYYFITIPIKHDFDKKAAKNGFMYLEGIYNMLKMPLYLSLYTLSSASEKNIIQLNDQNSIEQYMNNFLVSIAFIQDFMYTNTRYLKESQDLFSKLSSTSFCSVLLSLYKQIQKEYPPKTSIYKYTVQDAITENACSIYMSALLSRGIIQASYTTYHEMKFINEWFNHPALNLTNAYECLAMIQLFIAPAYEALALTLRNSINSSLTSLKIFLIVFYVVYVLFAVVSHFTFWTCYLKSTEEELIKSRGMLKIMPLKLINKLKQLSKEEENNTQSMKFFKMFEKNP